MLTIAGVDVPNTADELTVKQFDKLNVMETDKSLDSMERWVNKFVYLGVPEEAFDDMTIEEFKQIVQDWNEGFNEKPKMTTSVEIDGYTYESKEVISVKDISLIEKAWKRNVEHFTAESLAIIFKRTDLERKEHYADAHIRHKASLFNQQPASIAIPYLNQILTVITESAESALNDTEVVE